jgi:hypothetical protein
MFTRVSTRKTTTDFRRALAFRSQLRRALALPVDPNRDQQQAEHEEHRQDEEGHDAEVGPPLEAHGMHREQRDD